MSNQTVLTLLLSVCKIANEIDPQIQVTFDVASNHADGKVPILDLKVSLNRETGNIEYEFYKKPVASKVVTMKNSAMPWNVKYATLSQQCFKRIHNTSEDIPNARKVEIMNDFMQELYISGYSEYERKNILNAAYRTHLKIVNDVKKGLRNYYRNTALQENAKNKTNCDK